MTLPGFLRKKTSVPMLAGVSFLVALPELACTTTDAGRRTPDSVHRDGGSHPDAEAGSPGSPDSAVEAGSPEAGTADAAQQVDGGDASTGTADAADATGPAGGVLSGRLRVSDLFFLDSDAADPARRPISNDTSADAQAVSNPSLVGGYLGPIGGATDTVDVYTASLATGQSVNLYIAAHSDGTLPDFDLRLFDAQANLVDESVGTGPIETVTAPSGGTFYIQLYTATTADAGLYTLSVGTQSIQSVPSIARHQLKSTWPFVPGEALVKLRPGVQATRDAWAGLGAHPVSAVKNAVGYARVVLDPPSGTRALMGSARRHDATTTLAAIKRLRHAAGVLWAEPNYVRRAEAAPPNDPLFPAQWHYPQVSLLDAWDHTDGTGTIVAVIDTGVKKAHPDFTNADSSSQLLAGYDMISDPSIAADGDGRDANSDDPGDGDLLNQSSWHGSHVSGTIAAATNNGVGCAGIAPAAKILPVRALGVGGGITDDIVQGILYAAGLANDAGVLPAQRADVINMSLGSPGRSQATADAVALARAAGTIVVASAGNDSTNAANYSPAAEPGVVTVGATDLSKHYAWYSNFGNVLDVVAPGGDESTDQNGDGFPDGVLSLVYANGGKKLYTFYEGTSMAAPHVSGIFALMRAAYPNLTPDDVDAMLAGTSSSGVITQDLGPVGKDDRYGNGLINANLAVLAALDAASATPSTSPALLLSSTALDFGTADTSLPLELTNAGRGTLTVTSITADQPWVTISPGDVGVNTVSVDRTGLADGAYSATLNVQTNGGTGNVEVRMTVSSVVATGGNIGSVYVLVVKSDTNEVVAQGIATAADGYAFRMPGLPSGDYLVAAGTDLDDNGFVNDDGEAFGMFPVTSDAQIIHLTGDRSGVEFPVRFQYNVQPTAARHMAQARLR